MVYFGCVRHIARNSKKNLLPRSPPHPPVFPSEVSGSGHSTSRTCACVPPSPFLSFSVSFSRVPTTAPSYVTSTGPIVPHSKVCQIKTKQPHTRTQRKDRAETQARRNKKETKNRIHIKTHTHTLAKLGFWGSGSVKVRAKKIANYYLWLLPNKKKRKDTQSNG